MTNYPSIPNYNRLSTAEQSRLADSATINDFGIDGFTLMEIAASGAARLIGEHTGPEKKGVFFCGKGNNGGDAIAASRYLSETLAHHVTLVFPLGRKNLSPDTQKNLDLILKLQQVNSSIIISDETPNLLDKNLDVNYIVDGLLGTGLEGDVREPLKSLINDINKSDLPIFAMDAPTGLNADTGEVMGACIRANHTVTFGTNKIGFYLNNAKSLTGKVYFLELPFPNHLKKYRSVLINNKSGHNVTPEDRVAEHKYDNGVVHIIAGSEGLTGAAIMAAQSAWKKGAGAVFLYCPKKLLPIYEKNLPQVIKVKVGDDDDSYFKPSHVDQIASSLNKKKGSLLIGPGIGTNRDTVDFTEAILREHHEEVIIDADALQSIERLLQLPKSLRSKWILTPHIGEAKSYLKLKFDNDYSRLIAGELFVKNHQVSLLLKGSPTCYIDISGTSYITEYDTSMFTRAGFGDVLAGTISTNLAITKERISSALDALNSGFKKYQKHPKSDIFGPEHLI